MASPHKLRPSGSRVELHEHSETQVLGCCMSSDRPVAGPTTGWARGLGCWELLDTAVGALSTQVGASLRWEAVG